MCVACWAFNLTKDRHRKNVHYYYKTEKGLKKKSLSLVRKSFTCMQIRSKRLRKHSEVLRKVVFLWEWPFIGRCNVMPLPVFWCGRPVSAPDCRGGWHQWKGWQPPQWSPHRCSNGPVQNACEDTTALKKGLSFKMYVEKEKKMTNGTTKSITNTTKTHGLKISTVRCH